MIKKKAPRFIGGLSKRYSLPPQKADSIIESALYRFAAFEIKITLLRSQKLPIDNSNTATIIYHLNTIYIVRLLKIISIRKTTVFNRMCYFPSFWNTDYNEYDGFQRVFQVNQKL